VKLALVKTSCIDNDAGSYVEFRDSINVYIFMLKINASKNKTFNYYIMDFNEKNMVIK
jgi:hypothetical protein